MKLGTKVVALERFVVIIRKLVRGIFSSSPPSPLQEAPLILFIPIAKVSWASLDNAPWDMLPLPNLFKISDMGSISEISKEEEVTEHPDELTPIT